MRIERGSGRSERGTQDNVTTLYCYCYYCAYSERLYDKCGGCVCVCMMVMGGWESVMPRKPQTTDQDLRTTNDARESQDKTSNHRTTREDTREEGMWRVHHTQHEAPAKGKGDGNAPQAGAMGNSGSSK